MVRAARVWRLTDEERALAAANVALAFWTVQQMQRGGDRAVEILGYDDACGVASLALLRAAEAFDPTRGFAFSSFAVKVMRKAVIDAAGLSGCKEHRARQRWRVAPPAGGLPAVQKLHPPDCRSGADPTAALERRESCELALRLLALLPAGQREAIEAVWFEGRTSAATDRARGFERGTTRCRWQAGLRRLRELMERKGVTA